MYLILNICTLIYIHFHHNLTNLWISNLSLRSLQTLIKRIKWQYVNSCGVFNSLTDFLLVQECIELPILLLFSFSFPSSVEWQALVHYRSKVWGQRDLLMFWDKTLLLTTAELIGSKIQWTHFILWNIIIM